MFTFSVRLSKYRSVVQHVIHTFSVYGLQQQLCSPHARRIRQKRLHEHESHYTPARRRGILQGNGIRKKYYKGIAALPSNRLHMLLSKIGNEDRDESCRYQKVRDT